MSKGPDVVFPEQPDPARLAAQQGQNNVEAAIATALLNQMNEVTPYGTVTYSRAGLQPQMQGQPQPMPGSMAGGLPRDVNFMSGFRDGGGYSPAQLMTGGGPQAPGSIRVGNYDIPQFTRTVNLTPEAQAQLSAQQAIGMNLSNLAQENIGRVRQAQQQGISLEGLPQMVSGINAAPISGFNPPQDQIQSSLREFNPQAGIDVQGLFAINPDFASEGRRLEQATFERARSLLEPQFGQQMSQAEIRLSERGLPLSSQISQDILGGIEAQRGRALNELALGAVQAGRQEQQRLADLGLRTRGQQFGERAAMGQFANEAAGQAFQQGLMGGQFGNAAQQQAFAQALAGQQAQNQAQNLSFNQAASNAALQNAARQAAIQEQAYLRNLPLNDIATLMGTAGGVQLPQFQQTPNVAVQAPDLIGATLGAQQNAIQQAGIQQQARSSALGGLFGLGSTLLSGGMEHGFSNLFGGGGTPSDIRVKENIRKVGKYHGHNLYEYNYKWSPEKVWGVMAQEIEKVIPQAVTEILGIKAVYYGAI